MDTFDSSTAKTARVAVAEVHRKVVADLGWLFREQPIDDYGIDAQVEIIDDKVVTSRLLALQIKGGMHCFRQPGPGGWWYFPQARHIRYWTRHALPVVLVLVDTQTGSAYWQVVNSDTVVRTSQGGGKILVPETNHLDRTARRHLAQLAAGDPYTLRLRELQLAQPLMRMLANGHRLMIEIEERTGSATGRGSVTLSMFHPDPGYTSPLVTWGVALGTDGYAEAVPHMFAWASIRADTVPYEDVDWDDYTAEHPGAEFFDEATSNDFTAWRDARPDSATLRPYLHVPEGVAYWQLELRLNDLGNAFLLVDEFAQRGRRQLTPPADM
jgi:hypothetical protein